MFEEWRRHLLHGIYEANNDVMDGHVLQWNGEKNAECLNSKRLSPSSPIHVLQRSAFSSSWFTLLLIINKTNGICCRRVDVSLPPNWKHTMKMIAHFILALSLYRTHSLFESWSKNSSQSRCEWWWIYRSEYKRKNRLRLLSIRIHKYFFGMAFRHIIHGLTVYIHYPSSMRDWIVIHWLYFCSFAFPFFFLILIRVNVIFWFVLNLFSRMIYLMMYIFRWW